MTSILKKYWWLIALAIAVLILKLFPEKLTFLEKIDSDHHVISSNVLSQQSLTSIPVITITEIRWNKEITRSGTYLLSTLVDRKANAFGWTESTWKSPPIFAELKISRSDSKQWGEQYFFAAGNLHKDVVYFRIDRNKTQGVPCDPSGNYCLASINVVGRDIADNKAKRMPCDLSGHYCISRLQVIDSDTITIVLNGKEEYTYYKIDGMTQKGIRGYYNRNEFVPCNAKRVLDSAPLTGSETLISSLRNQVQQYTDRMNRRYWDLAWPLYVEGDAVFIDSNRISDSEYHFAKITNVSETIPVDCRPWGDPAEKRLGDFLFPAADPLGSSPFRRATQAEIDALRRRPDWPTTLEHCGADHPSDVFRAYDLSGDGQADFIFSSPCGGEDPWNHIWVHHGDSVHYVGAAQGLIRYFFDRRLGAFSVLINRGWCCASFDGEAEVFRFDASTFKLTRTASVLEVAGITLPSEGISPRSIVVAKEGAMLRDDPRVDDTPFAGDDAWQHTGNISASVKRGAKGKAVGQNKGSNGEIWWFVVLEPGAELSVDYLPWEKKEKSTSRAGWMNGNDLSIQ